MPIGDPPPVNNSYPWDVVHVAPVSFPPPQRRHIVDHRGQSYELTCANCGHRWREPV